MKRKNWTSRGARKRWLAERRKQAMQVEDTLMTELREHQRAGRPILLPGDFSSESNHGHQLCPKRRRTPHLSDQLDNK
ncbi:hypothetical protein [Actinomadura formosensis]|uniref:hypothetical protein n=1 Tax=Actinomadura formosensis TaxID=60706 RepID=UPI000AB7658B|nr:hypothetical protein [Actinomadura formosensis]